MPNIHIIPYITADLLPRPQLEGAAYKGNNIIKLVKPND